MSNFETGLSKDQAALLMSSIDYLSGSDQTSETFSMDGIVRQEVETKSGISIHWYQTTVGDSLATGIFFGRLELELEEEEGTTDVRTQIDFAVNDDGIDCSAKEVIEPEAGGYTDRTIKQKNLDETVRKMSKLLNQVYY